MKYKVLSNDKEYREVEELCIKHDMRIPKDGFTIIAVDENTGKVEGAISLRSVLFVEPLVSDNPVVAAKLFDKAEGVILAKGVDIVRCITKEENEGKFNKAGFIKVFNKQIVMEKLYT